MNAPLIQTEGLRKAIREGAAERVILDRVGFSVAPGEMVALVGPSGSGKSTLLNLVSGIDVPTAGLITVLGRELGALDETARTRFRRRHIGLVFQAFQLLSTLTVEENILLPMELDGRADRAAMARVAALCERVGLGDRRAAFPDVLSGGEQQRVALARAVLAEPRVVLADEPTGSLDEATGCEVLDLLTELCRERGCAVLMATHSRRAAAACDRALRLEAGTVLEAVVAPA
ncbi:MAG: ABC transporter ATP-binding protein [Planctomycetota bacterium]